MASSSSSQSSLPPEMQDREYRNWAELPPDLTSSILLRLGAVEILENAQKVCTRWRRVCKDPSMWRKIVMHDLREEYDLEVMCRHAVDRSEGGLVEIDIWHFGTDSLLTYIADRFRLSLSLCTNSLLTYIADSSSNLRSLKLGMCNLITDKGFVETVVKLPMLEELELSYCSLSEESLTAVGQSCQNLKTLKLNRKAYRIPILENDDEALAIAATMPGLRHLQLFGNRLTDAGLNAIIDSCPALEHLDIRQCFNCYLVGDLEKRCSEKIKVVRRPNDSTHDYPFDATVNQFLLSSDDYDSYDSYDSFGSSNDGFGFMPDDYWYYDFCNDSDNCGYDPYD